MMRERVKVALEHKEIEQSIADMILDEGAKACFDKGYIDEAMYRYLTSNPGENYRLNKIDRNGTMHFVSQACPRCGGTGHLHWFGHVENGVCFKCGGTGQDGKNHHYKLMLPSYEKALKDKRLEKRINNVDNHNQETVKRFRLAEVFYVVIGNTYPIKEEIKKAGGKFDSDFGWLFLEETKEFETIKVEAKDVFSVNDIGEYMGYNYEAVNRIKDLLKQMKQSKTEKTNNSEWVGEEGKRIELTVTLKKVCAFETFYSYYGEICYVYNFEDENGNLIVWKTQKNLDIDEGNTVSLTGTVKKHDTYKDVKQTQLTRCKIA